MMTNFGGCEGVSATYFDNLKALIDLFFFVSNHMDVQADRKLFLLQYFADSLLNFPASETYSQDFGN